MFLDTDDNVGEPQFTSSSVEDFAKRGGIKLETCIPYLSCTNRKAKATVKDLKKLVVGCGGLAEKLADGLIVLRNTGIKGGIPPAVAAFTQRLCEQNLPCANHVATGKETKLQRKGAEQHRKAQKKRYDKHAHKLPKAHE